MDNTETSCCTNILLLWLPEVGIHTDTAFLQIETPNRLELRDGDIINGRRLLKCKPSDIKISVGHPNKKKKLTTTSSIINNVLLLLLYFFQNL